MSAETISVPYLRRSVRRPVGRHLLRYVATYAILCAGGAGLMIPFLWMLSTSLKPTDQVFTWPVQWIPDPIVWRNYAEALEAAPFVTFAVNSSVITSLSIVGNLTSSSLVAFSFARLRFPGRRVLFLLMLSTMMVPAWVTIIPTFLLFRALGWLDSYKPLIVPAYTAVPFYVFLLRQFFLTIPTELEDAARVDGCSTARIYATIILPLAKPALATVAIFSFMSHWNEFMLPLIYIRSQEKYTIALGLRMFQGEYQTFYHLLMAASVMALLPCLVLFFFAQRLFIQGIVITGVKG